MINGGLDQGERAGADAGDLVQDVLMPLAPEGLSSVTLTDGSSAVEKAIFAAMRERGSDTRFSVMGFNGANHGNSLALTQFAHPNMSLQLGWPSIKYPESVAQESQILDEVRSTLKAKREASEPVAAILIEPTNAQSGHSASAGFIREL